MAEQIIEDAAATIAGEPDPIAAPASYAKPGESGKRRGRPPGSAAGRADYRPTKLHGPIERGYLRVGMVAMKYDPPLGVLVRYQAPKCAQAWDELAKSNTQVKKFLTWLVELGNRGGLAGAHAPILMYFADRYGLLEKIPFVGDLWKETLESFINQLLQEAIAEGILSPAPPPVDVAAANGAVVGAGGA